MKLVGQLTKQDIGPGVWLFHDKVEGTTYTVNHRFGDHCQGRMVEIDCSIVKNNFDIAMSGNPALEVLNYRILPIKD